MIVWGRWWERLVVTLLWVRAPPLMLTCPPRTDWWRRARCARGGSCFGAAFSAGFTHLRGPLFAAR